jgi:predicted GIY-YIG superfamily endonuclease
MKSPAVYIMANKPYGALYAGVTSNLVQRVYQHKEGSIPGFTTRYGCKRLVWYEQHSTMETAILREKQIKAGSRQDKLDLIKPFNPEWTDLYPSLL